LTITHLAYRIAHEFTGSVVALAAMMGKGQQVLTNKLNPNYDSHHLSIEELEMMGDFTNRNIDIARYFADKANAVVVKVPDAPMDGDMSLLDGFLDITREMGEMSFEFQKSWADGEITKREFQCIKSEVSDVQSKLLAWLAAIERVSK